MSRISAPQRSWVLDRADGMCERCGCDLSRGWECHHRRFRSQGGTNEVANLAALCSFLTHGDNQGCHELVHRRRLLAEGCVLSNGQDPAAVPILHHLLGRVFLSPDGSYERTQP